MIGDTLVSNGVEYTQISWRSALRVARSGKPIWLQTNKLRFDNPYQPAFKFEAADGLTEQEFINLVNQFKYYNCNTDTGNQCHFFAQR